MSKPPGFRACMQVAVAGAVAVVLAAPAEATVQQSRACRASIGDKASALVRVGFRNADVCHQKKDRVCTPAASGGSDREACLVITSEAFDPLGNVAAKKAEVIASIGRKCLPGDPVAANYAGGAIATSIVDAIEDDIEGSSSAVQGVADLECNEAKMACHAAIGRARTDVLRTSIRDAVRCQKKLDRAATTFGPIDPSCLAPTAAYDRILARANARILAACSGLTGSDVGSCDPLPGCVTGAATATAHTLAQAAYSTLAPQVCGNGTTEGTEQCDDANTVSGDGCSATCESEGDTCNGAYAGVGAADGIRQVTITLSTPEPLGGVEVNLDYPQLQIGIPGLGNSALVNARLSVLQPGGISGLNDSGSDAKVLMVNLSTGLVAGPLFRVDFDNCVSASESVCNRAQNVVHCCFDPGDSTQFARCSDGTTPCTTNGDCTGIGSGICGPPVRCVANPPGCANLATLVPPPPGEPILGGCSSSASGTPLNGGCPGDNACVSQASIMTCSVANPSSLLGTPVEGVTCSVSIAEVP